MSKKGKIAIIVMSVLLAAFVLYGVVSTVAVREAFTESAEWKSKYNEVVKNYKEVSDKYIDKALENVNSSPVVLESVAKSIDDNAEVSAIGRVVYMYVPCSTDVMEVKGNVEKYVTYISSALKMDYDSCIIIAVNETGKCLGGWTILQNGDNYAFVSE